VTEFKTAKILKIAFHIVPWKEFNRSKNVLDVDNGILLSPTYDAVV